MLNAFGVRLGGLAKKSSLRARCRCSHWQSSTLDLGDGGVRYMHTSLAEATLFRKHRNQISTWSCSFSSIVPRPFLRPPRSRCPTLIGIVFVASSSSSFSSSSSSPLPSSRLDRNFARDDRCRESASSSLSYSSSASSSSPRLQWVICVDRASEVHKINYVCRAQETSKTHKTSNLPNFIKLVIKLATKTC